MIKACQTCYSKDVDDGFTDMPLRVRNIYVSNIPSIICLTCAAYYVTPKIKIKLEKFVEFVAYEGSHGIKSIDWSELLELVEALQ